MEKVEKTLEPPSKRKKDKGKRHHMCIVHFFGIVHGTFKYFKDDNTNAKLKKILEIKKQRLDEPIASSTRMQQQCSLIPDSIEDHHGYHTNCYKRFTGNLNRLRRINPSPSESSRSVRPKRRSPRNKDLVVSKPVCIFCKSERKKSVKKGRSWTTQGLSNFTRDGWVSVLEMAERKKDHILLAQIRVNNLFASASHFHRRCLINYMQSSEKWRSKDNDACDKQDSLIEAHEHAFNAVCAIVEADILSNGKMMKLSALNDTYKSSLMNTTHSNPHYRNENLKTKLMKKYPNQLVFAEMKTTGPYQSSIVFSSALEIKSAVREAYILGSADTIRDVGITMHHVIIESHNKSPEMKWPPLPNDLQDPEMPDALTKLLSFIICGKEISSNSHTNRIVQSIAQDICRASTNGTWKLPKHVLLVMCLRHLFRSKSLITLLNRFGHCESYDFSLELETALAEAVESSSPLLSSTIIKNPASNVVFHSEFDNFDKLLNNLTGKDSIHTAHGIMLQELHHPSAEEKNATILKPKVRTKKKVFHGREAVPLPECYVTVRGNPIVPVVQLEQSSFLQAMEETLKFNILWIFLRSLSTDHMQPIPSWSGFLSSISTVPQNLTTIDYYPVINQPITEYKTVQECLRVAEEATKELGQNYIITTFDMGVCMKAFPLIWQNPERYKKHIVLIGTFHLECAFMKVLGKKMKGSGLEDVLLESGLISGGSLAGVMQGKHYARSLHCHKVVLEALEELLLEKLYQDPSEIFSSMSHEAQRKINTLLQSPSPSSVSEVLGNLEITSIINNYLQFRQTDMGKTAKLWISYMNHVHLLLSLIDAVKTNNYELYVQSIIQMSPLFFSFDCQNYARYLTYMSVFLMNIDFSHPGASDLIKCGAFSVARSFIPGCRCATDKTMEETFMKHAKSRGGAGSSGEGLTGILTNYPAYQRWIRTTHIRAFYSKATFSMVEMGDTSIEEKQHRDLKPTKVQKSALQVKKVKEAINSFMDPFNIGSNDELIVLSSGAAASEDIAADVLSAEEKGVTARDHFIESRLRKGQNFFDPITRMNLKSLEDTRLITKMKAAKGRMIQYKEQATVAFRMLVKSQDEGISVDMRELMTYPLTTIPFSIATGKD